MAKELFAGVEGFGGIGLIASHWDPKLLVVATKLTVASSWAIITNRSVRDLSVYMELEVIRQQIIDQTLVATLPGSNNFNTEMGDRTKVLTTVAVPVLVPAGGSIGVGAAVQLDASAVPIGAKLNVNVRVRRVDNAAATQPRDVGPVVENGEHIQNGVIEVTGVALVAEGLPFLTAA